MSLNWQWKKRKRLRRMRELKRIPRLEVLAISRERSNDTVRRKRKRKHLANARLLRCKEHGERCLKDGIYQDHVFHLYKHKSNVKLAQLLAKYMVTVIWEDMPNEQNEE